MPAERRVFTATKPIKTERTHEENQERAYIAASRRSDRSLEARIESARRASEIHKKRTGRALRVTEQDVINEEMYEEEDDDIPTQYQRLSAHLHTSSVNFNRKLHDYIATQHGVRNMFMSQYQNPPFQPYSMQFQPGSNNFSQMQHLMNQQAMLPPQTFNPSSPGFNQLSQPFSPQSFQQQQQGFRQAPYHIPQRPPSHQRSASIPTPHATSNFGAPVQQSDGTATTPLGDGNRRMSLPPQAFEQSPHPAIGEHARPPLSRSPTSQSIQQHSNSPQNRSSSTSTTPSAHGTPPTKLENVSPTYPLTPMNFATGSQVLNMNPLSMSLPPESQQLIGSALDPNDPRTAIFMAGSEQIPQPFPTYTYNPNLNDPKSTRTGITAATSASLSSSTGSHGMSQTLAPSEAIKLETAIDISPSIAPNSAMTEPLFSAHDFLTPGGYDYQPFFDSAPDLNGSSGDGAIDSINEEEFVNWAA